MMNKMKLLVFLMLFVLPELAMAQREKYPLDWFLRDVEQDSMFGTGVQRIYKELLPGKKPTPLIVAVIDSGFDTTAQMLRPVLWHNPGEIAGNGKDDDHNGYVDDIHGWNFMGTRDGKSLSRGVPEELRTYSWLLKTYKGNMKKMSPDERDLFVTLYKTYAIKKVEYERKSIEAKEGLKEIKHIKKQDWFKQAYKVHLAKKAAEPVLTDEERLELFKAGKLPRTEPDTVDKILYKEKAYLRAIELDKELFTVSFDIRKELGDNPYDINDKKYGNPYFPLALSSKHGTHVASTIGGVPEPKSGVYGIAQGVRMMLLQVVPPGGDEEDKDIALAIRYAVDNGAKVINMSFGKYMALPQTQKWIEEAMDYAAAHDVLVVRAAGNNSKNIDRENVYPLRPSKPETQASYICVGAHGSNLRAEDRDNKLVIFSNYGKKSVDLFAPGHSIYSQVPNGRYSQESGTSMASPVCAGVAALIRLYYPTLTAVQVKDILMKTVTPNDQPCKFGRQSIKFSDLSISGGMLNGYEAMKLAEEIVSKGN